MEEQLKRTYFILLAPPVAGFILAFAAREYGLIHIEAGGHEKLLAAATFVLSVVTGVALPIFLRTLFAHKNRDRRSVPEVAFLKFERSFLRVALATPYLAQGLDCRMKTDMGDKVHPHTNGPAPMVLHHLPQNRS